MSKKKKTELSIAVGRRIKQVQRELGFTNNEMAVTLGISEGGYKAYCRGDVLITTENIVNFINTFSVNPKFLLQGDLSEGLFVEEGFQVSSDDLHAILSGLDVMRTSMNKLAWDEKKQGMIYMLQIISDLLE